MTLRNRWTACVVGLVLWLLPAGPAVAQRAQRLAPDASPAARGPRPDPAPASRTTATVHLATPVRRARSGPAAPAVRRPAAAAVTPSAPAFGQRAARRVARPAPAHRRRVTRPAPAAHTAPASASSRARAAARVVVTGHDAKGLALAGVGGALLALAAAGALMLARTTTRLRA